MDNHPDWPISQIMPPKTAHPGADPHQEGKCKGCNEVVHPNPHTGKVDVQEHMRGSVVHRAEAKGRTSCPWCGKYFDPKGERQLLLDHAKQNIQKSNWTGNYLASFVVRSCQIRGTKRSIWPWSTLSVGPRCINGVQFIAIFVLRCGIICSTSTCTWPGLTLMPPLNHINNSRLRSNQAQAHPTQLVLHEHLILLGQDLHQRLDHPNIPNRATFLHTRVNMQVIFKANIIRAEIIQDNSRLVIWAVEKAIGAGYSSRVLPLVCRSLGCKS